MLKLITPILGLAIGFGGGVWWGQKNPEAAGKLSAEEERQFLQAQMQISQKIQAKLDQLGSKSSKAPGSGFLSGSQSGGPSSADVNELKAETAQQQQALQQHMDKLKK